ncbi:c-type cytochrome biogenesis protein CcsB [Galactobacter caseinivorans]|uniref:C-type cytochrome biogenesis protein CcsB n=2 Tax=Galactobacter caseinivorans TaxID=2676123 RepID=A0A496PN98_9MICC|nr:c-type cytochrome biogenesis protein CcsB [Galactobacter caseinivorans]
MIGSTEIDLALGTNSELAMLLAAMAYAVALVVFTLDLVRSSRTVQELEQSLLAQEDKELVGVGGAVRVSKGARSATARGGAAAQSGTAGTGGTGAGDDASSGTAPRVRHGNAEVDGQLVDDSMDYTRGAPRRGLARVAISLMALAAVIHLAAVIMRSIAAGRVPWGNMYEFLTTGALIVAVVFLVALIFKDIRFMGVFVSALVVVMMCAATMGFPTPVQPLQPALQSPWLIIHVSIAVLSSALFTLTFAMAVLQLIQSYRQKALIQGKPDRLPLMRLVPSATSLENVAYRINALAFVGWSITLILGAVWAEAAWGRYWGWDVKEVWTFIIWVIYAGYLHARATRGWTGNRSAWLSIVGYACVVFNFTAVNIIFPGLHSYAGT